MRLPALLLLMFVFTACEHPNPTFPGHIGHIHRVVILGNSIVSSPPVPARGWNNYWGMAASAQDKDFVHLLIDSIHAHSPNADIAFRNISAFERSYRSYDLRDLDSLKGADLYIVKLAENVPDTATNFIPAYDSLLHYLDTSGGIIVIMNGFWRNPINDPLKHYAAQHADPFISISDLSRDTSMEARKFFSDFGVGVHPGDKGMKAISDRIWEYIRIYF